MHIFESSEIKTKNLQFIYLKKIRFMKKNMGTIDKIIRTALAVVVAILYFTGVVEGTLGIVLLVLAAVFVLTSLIGFCPLYPVVGLNTEKKKE